LFNEKRKLSVPSTVWILVHSYSCWCQRHQQFYFEILKELIFPGFVKFLLTDPIFSFIISKETTSIRVQHKETCLHNIVTMKINNKEDFVTGSFIGVGSTYSTLYHIYYIWNVNTTFNSYTLKSMVIVNIVLVAW
jgi:hypothetical protein